MLTDCLIDSSAVINGGFLAVATHGGRRPETFDLFQQSQLIKIKVRIFKEFEASGLRLASSILSTLASSRAFNTSGSA